jgi:hypothetical protein
LHYVLKFPTQKGVVIVQGNQVTLRQHASTSLKDKKALILNQQGSLKDRVEVRTKTIEQFKEVVLREKEGVVTKIGSTLKPPQ